MRVVSLWLCNFWFSPIISMYSLFQPSTYKLCNQSTLQFTIDCTSPHQLHLLWLFSQIFNNSLTVVDLAEWSTLGSMKSIKIYKAMCSIDHLSTMHYPWFDPFVVWSISFNSKIPCWFNFIFPNSCSSCQLLMLFIVAKPWSQNISFLVYPEHLRRLCRPLTT